MAAGLQGERELRARLRALKLAFKPLGRNWADDTARLMKGKVPERTGRLRRSFRRKNATQKRATVAGQYTAFFIDAGPKAHDIIHKGPGTLVFKGRHGTVFARKVHHRGYRARPFRQRAAEEGLRRNPGVNELIDQWNRAA